MSESEPVCVAAWQQFGLRRTDLNIGTPLTPSIIMHLRPWDIIWIVVKGMLMPGGVGV